MFAFAARAAEHVSRYDRFAQAAVPVLADDDATKPRLEVSAV
jgi:hypothetical protein